MFVAAVLLILGMTSPVAAQPEDPELKVTFAARVCREYTDIMANKARNNLQESLRDLGPDSTYEANDVVDPDSEQAGSPNCRPLVDWRFTTGANFTGRSPETDDLSTVTEPFRSDIVTRASVPRLDENGEPVAGQTIEGAVTKTLRAEEVERLQNGGVVWVQGGTPDNPLNKGSAVNPEGNRLGYGALRCAQDAINGDNVEQVTYPSGSSHVFCYYYAVSPPPGQGEITVKKQVEDGTPGSGDFRFDGNISYADNNDDGVNDFTLSASDGSPGEQTFIRGETRAGDEPWTFTEAPQAGWSPPSAAECVSETGASDFTTAANGSTSVTLAEGDRVTCTYTNHRLTGPASLQKETIGGTGSFDFRIEEPDGSVREANATTVVPGQPVVVASTAGSEPGRYTITETLPEATGAGYWTLTAVHCNGENVPFETTETTGTAQVDVEAGENVECLFTNTFNPDGSIRLDKTTRGGTGTFQYRIAHTSPGPSRRISADYRQQATTTEENVAAEGEPIGEAPTGLRVGPGATYTIQEYLPPPGPEGTWRLVSADCGPNQTSVDPETSSVSLRLTKENPDASCHFVNELIPPGEVEIAKTTTGDTGLRPGPVRVEYTCDGTSGTLEVAPGETAGEVEAFHTNESAECEVEEPETGAADGVDVSTGAALVVDGESRPYDFGEPFTVDPGQRVRVEIDNEYKGPPPPSPTPTPGPTDGPDGPDGPDAPGEPGPPGAGPGGDLAYTGVADFLWTLGGVAALAIAAGTGVAIAARRRRS